MYKKTLLITLLFGMIGTLNAQEGEGEKEMSTDFGFGFQLNQHQRDFGSGIHLTSPYFIYDKVAVRMRGNILFNQHLEGTGTTWTPYFNASVGLIGVSGTIGNFMRMYSEGGFITLFPSSDFSSTDIEYGGYGVFGFEFYSNPDRNYFIEIGGVGTGAKADNVPGSPIYSNGLLINTGFRMHF